MITVRASDARGAAKFSWLDSKHTFSFGQYYDPRFMGFGPLRVINEDRVDPGAGFPPHSHADMEIISYVIEGGLEHKDSEGNSAIIRPGEIQIMSAGQGITHSEYNASKSDGVHFLQIWVQPNKRGLKPGYQQVEFPLEDRVNALTLLGSRDERDGSVKINQDVDLHGAVLKKGEEVSFTLTKGRGVYIHVVKGQLSVNDVPLETGDGAAVTDETQITLEGESKSAEFILFDLPN